MSTCLASIDFVFFAFFFAKGKEEQDCYIPHVVHDHDEE